MTTQAQWTNCNHHIDKDRSKDWIEVLIVYEVVVTFSTDGSAGLSEERNIVSHDSNSVNPS